ncbi:M14 family zinc carboxypeptidase [Paludibaculum fermentans]|uniref:M14 family zinc carboxypeptidase n=1 Tax=Paludibaculum fermentans TaxID=1473598 RepID=UPI003EB8B294
MSRVTCPAVLFFLGASLALAQTQKLDDGYAKKIREFTTDPMFLTELVDHLPVSDKVPTPEKFLGYIAGAENKLTYAKDIYRYMREVEKTSPRVRVLSIGQTEENREMVVVVVSSEANLARLDRLKQITATLADPRKTTPAEADKLIAEGLPFYWATASIHSPETGSPEMSMELVYRLAVEETPFIQKIRDNAIVLVTPVVEVDGREKMVDLYRWKKENPGKIAPSLLYWGKYVAHDNNRDGMALSLALSRNITKAFLQFHPQVLHDLHESVPFLYTSTGMGPYNAWLDPIVINEWQKLAYYEIEEMTKRGVPGVWTHGFYDGWAANYLMEVAHGHNSIGRFYETFGNGGADTRERTVPAAQTTRAWFRPNPPLPKVKWSQRNNVNMQQSALLLAMNYTATNKETFLRNFWLKSQRSVAKATTEGPAAYIIDASVRPNEAASLADQLAMHGVEVQRLTQPYQGNAAGAYVVRMDQPYSRLADMLLDRQYYNANDTPPYDDTGWTVQALRNLKSARITDVAVLKAAMAPVTGSITPEGKLTGDGAVYAINHNADRVLATLRYKLKDIKMNAAEEAFEAEGQKFVAGSFLIPASGNPSDLRQRLQSAATELGVNIVALKSAPKTAQHPLAAPRIALVHNWLNTQNEGWFRLAMDTTGVPYTYISDHTVAATADLRSKFDVIILGPMGGTAQRIVNGMPKRGEPVPWKASTLTPNFGTSPDQTDDIRGGLGLEGVQHIRDFVEAGGLFITIGGNASLPITYGLIDGITIQPTRELKVRGSVLDSAISDARSPIAYGYSEHLPVYMGAELVLNASATAGLGGGGGGQAASVSGQNRASGRGGVTDPDIIQGRPPAPAVPEPKPGELSAEMLENMRAYLPTPAERPRTILKFGEEKDLLISGLLAGGRELAGKPALVDVPQGKGHYVLFAINPMWRQQTQGSFMLLFNAAMNFENLGAGRPAGTGRLTEPPTAGDDDFNDQMQ